MVAKNAYSVIKHLNDLGVIITQDDKVYLNMYNPLIVILCFFINSYYTFYALCFIFLCISLIFNFVTVCDCYTE